MPAFLIAREHWRGAGTGGSQGRLPQGRCPGSAKGLAEGPSRSIRRQLSAEDGLAGAAPMVPVSWPWAAAALGARLFGQPAAARWPGHAVPAQGPPFPALRRW